MMMFQSIVVLASIATSVLASDSIPKVCSTHLRSKRSSWGLWNGKTTLTQAGVTGIGAMQVSVVDDDSVLIYDKAEHNPLKVNNHPAWGAIYQISTQTVRPLNLQTNSFCAGGGWLSNGTMLSVGGNPAERVATGSGRQGVRFFNPCGTNGTCDVYEDPADLHLASNRWYPSTTRLDDGSLMIMGGDLVGGFNDNAKQDNPTFEFWPPKNGGGTVFSKFLQDALNTNLFPVSFSLIDGTIFLAANKLAMIYNWRTNTETRLPGIPNGVRINYPSSAAAVLLPLTIANNFTPEVLICGGSTANVDGAAILISALTPASTQCIRMVLDAAGIAKGWQIEQLPQARTMGDAILTPDGKVLIINGAGSGVAGYGNVRKQVGQSNAANPVYRADLYDPLAAAGNRFLTNFPSSNIERLYHSSATLLPDGRIWVAGSNPNPDVTTKTFATRYEVEIFSPPYVTMNRPTFTKPPSHLYYNQKSNMTVTFPTGAKVITAVVMDLGYSTHGVHASIRSVELYVTRTVTGVTFTSPASAKLYPPGYGWRYILADGVPSKGMRVMVGSGANPPFIQ